MNCFLCTHTHTHICVAHKQGDDVRLLCAITQWLLLPPFLAVHPPRLTTLSIRGSGARGCLALLLPRLHRRFLLRLARSQLVFFLLIIFLPKGPRQKRCVTGRALATRWREGVEKCGEYQTQHWWWNRQ